MSVAESLLTLAILAQVVITFAVYVAMARKRYAAGRRGEIRASDYVVVQNEPPELARATRAVANQFELPVIFYALVLLILVLDGATLFGAAVAWLFVASRVAHAIVHVGSTDVMRRARLFQLGFAFLVALALHPLYIAMAGLV